MSDIMHSKHFKDWNIHYNSDLSGDIIINNNELGEEIEFPAELIKELVESRSQTMVENAIEEYIEKRR